MSVVRLDGVLGALNHLIAAYLDEAADGGSALALESVTLDETGCRIAGRIRSASHIDRFLLRLEVAPPQGDLQALRLSVEQWPAHLPAPVETFRRLLDKARITVELDFGA